VRQWNLGRVRCRCFARPKKFSLSKRTWKVVREALTIIGSSLRDEECRNGYVNACWGWLCHFLNFYFRFLVEYEFEKKFQSSRYGASSRSQKTSFSIIDS